jgi:ribosomal protein S20
MSDWDVIREKIIQKELKHNSWQSDRKHLLIILDAAEQMGIDPSLINKTSYSNLRTIIKSARKAIFFSDKEKLTRLFIAASSMPTAQLRSIVSSNKLEVIKYKESIENDVAQVNLLLTQSQFEQIKICTKNKFIFIKS